MTDDQFRAILRALGRIDLSIFIVGMMISFAITMHSCSNGLHR